MDRFRRGAARVRLLPIEPATSVFAALKCRTAPLGPALLLARNPPTIARLRGVQTAFDPHHILRNSRHMDAALRGRPVPLGVQPGQFIDEARRAEAVSAVNTADMKFLNDGVEDRNIFSYPAIAVSL